MKLIAPVWPQCHANNPDQPESELDVIQFVFLLTMSGLAILAGCTGDTIANLKYVRRTTGPRRRSFEAAVQAQANWHTILIPAVVTLATGLGISLSASYLFSHFTEPDTPDTYLAIGLALFVFAVMTPTILLSLALSITPEPTALLNNPGKLWAAAEQHARNPSHAMIPMRELKYSLGACEKYLTLDSLGLWPNASTAKKRRILEKSSRALRSLEAEITHRPWPTTRRKRCIKGWRIYRTGLFSNLWLHYILPFIGAIAFPLGITWAVILYATEIDNAAVAVLLTAASSTLFSLCLMAIHCISSGLKAYKSYRLNLSTIRIARRAVSAAKAARLQTDVTAAGNQRLVEFVDSVQFVPNLPGRGCPRWTDRFLRRIRCR